MRAMLGGLFRRIAGFGPWVLLGACLFLLAVILSLLGLVFGFDLGDVDAWLEAHGGWFNAVGILLLRIACGLVLALCLFVALAPLLFREEKGEGRPGWGCALLAIVVGFFAWTGMTMRY